MTPPDLTLRRLWQTMALTALAVMWAAANTMTSPAAVADPEDSPPAPAPANNNPAPEESAPEPGRVNNDAGGFSYVVPDGWIVADASRLNYGQALLSKQAGPAQGGQLPPIADDTSILLGRLDLKLFAGAEQDNAKAAIRLASDMGEFFMPYAGTRINQHTQPLQAGDLPGSSSSYEVKFTDTTKPNGQIWSGVVGTAAPHTLGIPPPPGTPPASSNQPSQRWFVVWLGTSEYPVDATAATALAESIRPWSPPPPPPPPDPAAPPQNPSPTGGSRVGVPIPVQTPVPEMQIPG